MCLPVSREGNLHSPFSMNFYKQWSDPNLIPAMKELNKKNTLLED